MKPLFAIAAATAVATAAHAEPVQFQFTFDNLQFRFQPDDDIGDENDFVSGFLYPDDFIYSPENEINDPNSEFYDPSIAAAAAAAADAELRDIFSNDLPNGGAEFVRENELNRWVLPQELNPASELTLTFSLDPDDFLKESVIAAGDDFEGIGIAQYSTPISAVFRDNAGTILESAELFEGFVTVSGDDVDIGTGIGDLIAIGAFEEGDGETVEIRDLGIFFGNQNPGEGNWFQDALADGENALDYALNTEGFTRFLEYREVRLGTDDGVNFQQLGIFELQGTLASVNVATGEEDAPLLPDTIGETSEGTPVFNFVVDIPDNDRPLEPIWIDPDVAVGYVYEILDSNGNQLEIAGVQAPGLGDVNDPDGYFISFKIGNDEFEIAINPGESLLFADVPGVNGPVTEFALTGIDPDLGLDPLNPIVFQTGIIPGAGVSGAVTFTQTPITIFVDDDPVSAVPLPMPLAMLLSGLLGLGLLRRRTVV